MNVLVLVYEQVLYCRPVWVISGYFLDRDVYDCLLSPVLIYRETTLSFFPSPPITQNRTLTFDLINLHLIRLTCFFFSYTKALLLPFILYLHVLAFVYLCFLSAILFTIPSIGLSFYLYVYGPHSIRARFKSASIFRNYLTNTGLQAYEDIIDRCKYSISFSCDKQN